MNVEFTNEYITVYFVIDLIISFISSVMLRILSTYIIASSLPKISVSFWFIIPSIPLEDISVIFCTVSYTQFYECF